MGLMRRAALLRGDRQYDLSAMEVLWLGGQAPAAGLIRWWREQHGVAICQAWGMTEATLATFTTVKRRIAEAGPAAREAVVARQGLAMPLVELRIVDDAGTVLPWDGTSVGEYQLRGPTVAGSYYGDGSSGRGFTADGWLRTGDIGTIDPDGSAQLVDRTADLIKSGGEWISSVQLENALMAHPQVVEAAVVAIPDERWLERPLACVVTRGPLTAEDLRDVLADRFARWQLPAEFLVLPEIPKTGIGKFDKKALRARFAEPAGREALRAPARDLP
jgi:fatty-acyl-CoA synthase